MLLEIGSIKPMAVMVGVSSLTLGLVETAMSTAPEFLGPLNIAAGGSLLIALWVGQRVARVAERFFEDQGSKLISLPTAAQLSDDKRSLFEKLEALAHEAAAERRETAEFRRELSATLADHGARLRALERAQA